MNKSLLRSLTNNTQKGMTFIEVLVALVIMVTGILGAVAMQVTAKQGSFDAMQRSIASSLAQDIIARIRANDANNLAAYATNGIEDYGVTLNPLPAITCNGINAQCTPAQMVTNDIFEWERALVGADVTSGVQNSGGLINGRGCVLRTGNALTVVVSWQGRNEMTDSQKSDGCGAAGKKRRQVVVQAFII
ncbi:type IV pilus modification protein PilV [Colwellia psychrerythraea]|uniref:Type IV pilus modification protein PilV n=1 Tax=Colwellia psychrerythraea TaxID=28229 RepID=A0A099KNN4_COLPS|nr:type IV pilus modification protein PilV [Colwellia psychrerythraea]KGJ91845.1 type IV pilus modification protein PilV [Colwellia psychrerythraea]